MQQQCTQCGGMNDSASRFCTNCGATQPERYRQSWEAPVAQNSGQVPSWSQSQSNVYQQPWEQNKEGSLGFGGPQDSLGRSVVIGLGLALLIWVILLILCIVLAIAIPITDLRIGFVVVAILLIAIPWIIFNKFRSIIRRTFGDFGRFF